MRVTEGTTHGTVNEALRRSRSRMEDLQIKNATQKKLLAPSDDPAGHSKIMSIRSEASAHSQFENNALLAKNRLVMTDAALNELYDLASRAKEIAIGQSSEASANADSRLGVAEEVTGLYQQLVSIANKRVGDHYLFGGFKTLTQPYAPDGRFLGDTGEMPVEIQKEVYVTMNITGPEVFEVERLLPGESPSRALASFSENEADTPEEPPQTENANPQDKKNIKPLEKINIFKELDTLRIGLLTNDTITIRDTLDRFDEIIRNTVTMRSKLSARVAGIDTALAQTSKTDISNTELASQLEDADYADLWSKLAKEETVMRSSLSAAQKLIQPTLLDFLK